MKKTNPILVLLFLVTFTTVKSQTNDVTAPLHLLQPEYPTPYVIPETANVKVVLDRVYDFLEHNTASKVINKKDNSEVTNFKKLGNDIAFEQGAFRLTSYEWGVTYAGMLLTAEATADKNYENYVDKRLQLIADLYANTDLKNSKGSPIHSVIEPHALDDAGALCAAFIKAKKQGLKANIDPVINNLIAFISQKQQRLSDGTLARNRPQMNTLWLDDMFMSVPALAQMGAYSGDVKYFDDAVKQVTQFSQRMFNAEKGLYMHGWVEGMATHPQFHWARANGWAVMTMVELLETLPKNHPGYPKVLAQLQAHIAGLQKYQDGTGFWHQLIDRNDTYLETSATAIYAYSIARAINRGYVDKLAYAPTVLLAWNAVASKVNAKGQVEGTCVGTGMGFDPAFYYYRPINLYAAHGYGPVLLAGAEVINMLKNNQFEINDSSIQLKVKG
ncbi:glycoside hydrolase family 88 protein [Flavobacterium sp.]|uniref:glycoside hydrolase family 88/105 protein n=1 Tax=Flavobacterium sp. TaxID=239 RepID=UPI002B517731|nr:glycoside hydrolase family 88 protein [Flavobacterium sp.]HSD07188.1 glycoside hydrolase family 88 protein [Flavobacterium sp.]